VDEEEGVYDRIYKKHACGDTSVAANPQKPSIKLGNTSRSILSIGKKGLGSTVTIAGDELMNPIRRATGKLLGDASTRRANSKGDRSGTKTGSGGESPSK